MGELFDRMTLFSTLLEAFDYVKANEGCAGVDGISIDDFACDLDEELARLRRDLISDDYRPSRWLHTYIKKQDGGHRPLSIPTVRDRVAHTVALGRRPMQEAKAGVARSSASATGDEIRSGDFVFFLGGQDLEMEAIRQLLEDHAPGRFHDKRLAWGAAASDYADEIAETLKRGGRPVLIELELDVALEDDACVVIDHHGRRAGSDRRTSLEHVFELLRLPQKSWTRWCRLVAENDRGAIAALRRAGAGPEEILEIRNRDRRAQGISADQERAAREAISRAEYSAGDSLAVVRLPHGRTSPVTDFLDPAFGGRGCDNILVISPGEVNFFGCGEIVGCLDRRFPGLDGRLPAATRLLGPLGRQGRG